jgi:hypothetical protein
MVRIVAKTGNRRKPEANPECVRKLISMGAPTEYVERHRRNRRGKRLSWRLSGLFSHGRVVPAASWSRNKNWLETAWKAARTPRKGRAIIESRLIAQIVC